MTVLPTAESSRTQSICAGEGYVFGGDTLFVPGAYSRILSTSAGCDSTEFLTLTTLPAPLPIILGDTALCTGASASLTVGNFASYQWSSGENTAALEISTPGMYQVTVSDHTGCTGIAALWVKEFPAFEAIWQLSDPVCWGENTGVIQLDTLLQGQGPFEFLLNDVLVNPNGVFEGLSAGNWDLTVLDDAGCETAFSFALENPPELTLDLLESPPLDLGAQYGIPLIINQIGPFDYTWSPSEGLSCTDCAMPIATLMADIVYTLVVRTEGGCVASDSVWLRVRPAESVYVPTIFSPNGTDNAFFTVFGNPGAIQEIAFLRIYDRWGGLVFEGKSLGVNDESAGWDGRHKGRLVLPGVYVWYAEIRLSNGGVLQRSGEVTVLR